MFDGHHKMNVIVAFFTVIETHNCVKKGELHSNMEFGHYNHIFYPI